MCGRFTQLYEWGELVELYRLTDPPKNLRSRYNISPTAHIDVIVGKEEGGGLALTEMRWWLVPWWWKKSLKEVPSAFNARVESLAENKPMWREPFKRNRCLVPASGFYEWSGPKEDRRPEYIVGADGRPLTFAGLYDRWTDPETGDEQTSCAIIVGPANQWMSSLHNRMPVILEEKDFASWIAEPRIDLLRPPAEDRLRRWPVSKAVNSSRYREADSIEPAASGPG